jgi:hypothetical protein
MHSVLWLFPKAAAIAFAVAGLYFFLDTAPLAKLLGDWVRGRNFNRVFGTFSLLAADLMAIPQLRPWAVAVAGFVLFGTTVALLERRRYLHAVPGILLLGSLPLTLAAT